MSAPELLRIEGLRKTYAARRGVFFASRGTLAAVDDVSLQVRRGETVALVGESGSGKTTVGRLVLRLEKPDSGAIFFGGEDWLALEGRALARRRRQIQIIFQDPQTSLNPRMTAGDQIAEPLAVQGLASRREMPGRVAALLEEVGLSQEAASRYPHEFSGGQRQRIAIARALATRPCLLVCDEPVSALDVSVAAQIVNLLCDLKEKNDLSMLFISHDLTLVLRLADRVAVMYRGRIVEEGATAEIAARPLHPYTAALLAAGAGLAGPAAARPGLVVEAPRDGAGCAFEPRCPIARPRCATEAPERLEHAPGRTAACFFPGETGAVAGF